MDNENTNVTTESVTEEQEKVVTIITGAGVEPIKVEWNEELTVTKALEAADVKLKKGETPVIGEELIGDPDETLTKPGQMIVIDSMPANG